MNIQLITEAQDYMDMLLLADPRGGYGIEEYLGKERCSF